MEIVLGKEKIVYRGNGFVEKISFILGVKERVIDDDRGHATEEFKNDRREREESEVG